MARGRPLGHDEPVRPPGVAVVVDSDDRVILHAGVSRLVSTRSLAKEDVWYFRYLVRNIAEVLPITEYAVFLFLLRPF
jgi:hypothetical protein